MLTLSTHLKNLAFLLAGSLVLAFVGIKYADLGRFAGVADYYTVTVRLPRTGGLFTHSDVTYRGVSVGRVGPLSLTGEGVEAELRIRKSAPRIPSGTRAVVAGLSAVGEQYIDLQPDREGGPYLTDGAEIDQRSTKVPAPVTDVLSSVNALTRSVPLESLRTVVDEFGKAFEGRGDDLQVLLDNSADFVEAADQNLPATTRLLQDGRTVLRTQAEEARAIRDFATGARDLNAALKGSDADLRKLIQAAPEAATQVSGVLRDLDPSLGVVLANLLTTSEVAVTRQRGTEEFLVKVPAVVAAGATAIDGGKADFGMSVTFFKPLPCTEGYGATRYRNGLDLGTAPPLNSGAACTTSASSGVNVRGSAHAPGGGAVPDPVRPGSLPSGAQADAGPGRAGARLPGALGLPADPHSPTDLAGLLGMDLLDKPSQGDTR
ncbi:MlaD family protein [Streptomyces physcomitrii]|uniref:MlaD family protein n=1 Tax=Streptomyces physcomitrii TaxID=2724184 RepID=UPI00343F7B9F